MEKIILTLENGTKVNINKNQIVYFIEDGKSYTLVLSSGDKFTGTLNVSL